MAYTSQDPWIMNCSVRENTIMELKFEPKRYQEVILACGLLVDFKQFHIGMVRSLVIKVCNCLVIRELELTLHVRYIEMMSYCLSMTPFQQSIVK